MRGERKKEKRVREKEGERNHLGMEDCSFLSTGQRKYGSSLEKRLR